MFVIDSHCDTLSTLPEGGRLCNEYNVSARFPFLQFYADFVCTKTKNADDQYQSALSLLEAFHAAWDGVVVLDRASLDEGLKAPKSAILTLEGADCLTDFARLRAVYEQGVRVINPTWNYKNHLAASNLESGTCEDYGFTPVGLLWIRECENLGILLDASHLSDRAFWDLAEVAKKPFFASHSNCRAVCPHSRNLRDEQIRFLIGNGGIIGVNLYTEFITQEKTTPSLSGLFPHLDHLLELGGEDAIGIGFDIDGVGDDYPADVTRKESIHDRFYELLLEKYGQERTEKIMYKNYASFLKRAFS